MDSDALLALQLQREEEQAAARSTSAGGGGAPGGNEEFKKRTFEGRVNGAVQTTLSYEDPVLQAQALSVLPLEKMAECAEGAESEAAGEDMRVRYMLRWFKSSFFSWVNNPPCQHCGDTATQPAGSGEPSVEERAGGAGRVEIYSCGKCGGKTRFPRYNNVATLLHTRRGRCGEWANCFTLCCRAIGVDARYVVDWTDHVWTEVYSNHLRRWVHCDACEAVWDKPLLYEQGWGKPLTFVLAFHRWGVNQVSRRYSRKHQEVVARRGGVISEAVAEAVCRAVTGRLRGQLGGPARQREEQRDAEEIHEFNHPREGRVGDSAEEHLPGRQSGSEAWRRSRGEMGGDSPTTHATPNRGVLVTAGMAEGGTGVKGRVLASAENFEGFETAANLFDRTLDSKWLDFSAAGGRGISWVSFQCEDPNSPCTLTHYTLTSGNDAPERDPASFVLEGLLYEGASWQVLDKQTAVVFPNRLHSLTFPVPPQHHHPCTKIRLSITALRDPAAANSVQLTAFDFTLLPPVPELSASELEDIAACLGSLRSLGSSEGDSKRSSGGEEAVALVVKVLSNLIRSPSNPKFRQLRLSNQLVQTHLVKTGALTLIKQAGFSSPPTNTSSEGERDAAEDEHLVFQPTDESSAGLGKVRSVLAAVQRQWTLDPSSQQKSKAEESDVQDPTAAAATSALAAVAIVLPSSTSTGRPKHPHCSVPPIAGVSDPSSQDHSTGESRPNLEGTDDNSTAVKMVDPKVKLQEMISSEFTKLMLEGNLTANEAAAKAMANVKQQMEQ